MPETSPGQTSISFSSPKNNALTLPKTIYRILQLAVVWPLGVFASLFGSVGLVISFANSKGIVDTVIGIMIAFLVGIAPALYCWKAHLHLRRLIAEDTPFSIAMLLGRSTAIAACQPNTSESASPDKIQSENDSESSSSIFKRATTLSPSDQPATATAPQQASIAISIPANKGPYWATQAKQSVFIFCIPALSCLMATIPYGGSSVIFSLIATLIALCGTYFCHLHSRDCERQYQVTKRTTLQTSSRNVIKAAIPFNPNSSYTSPNGLVFICVDESRMQVMVGGCDPALTTYGGRVLNVSDIISAEVVENVNPALRTEAGNSLAGAAAGGLIFGGAGAVVGAIAMKNVKTISQVSLILTLDDIQTPLVSVNFLEAPVTKGISLAIICAVRDIKSGHVSFPLALISARTFSKIFHKIARCCSPSRVFRPIRTTSLYKSHVVNCQASTTSIHSPIRNACENLAVPIEELALLMEDLMSNLVAILMGPASIE